MWGGSLFLYLGLWRPLCLFETAFNYLESFPSDAIAHCGLCPATFQATTLTSFSGIFQIFLCKYAYKNVNTYEYIWFSQLFTEEMAYLFTFFWNFCFSLKSSWRCLHISLWEVFLFLFSQLPFMFLFIRYPFYTPRNCRASQVILSLLLGWLLLPCSPELSYFMSVPKPHSLAFSLKNRFGFSSAISSADRRKCPWCLSKW